MKIIKKSLIIIFILLLIIGCNEEIDPNYDPCYNNCQSKFIKSNINISNKEITDYCNNYCLDRFPNNKKD